MKVSSPTWPFGKPVCDNLSDGLARAASVSAGATLHRGGIYVCIEGPQFSTKAESQLYRRWGVDVIGMTNMPEAKLAREAELCYATLALATDYDCWHETEEAVTVEAILATLHQNVALAKRVLRAVVPAVAAARSCACNEALRNAIVTPASHISVSTRRRRRTLDRTLYPEYKEGAVIYGQVAGGRVRGP